MKKVYFIIGIILFILIAVFLRFFLGGDEDSWIKDSRGVYVKHGNPSEVPDYVLEQQELITCAFHKFELFSEEKNSQCLGICKDYAVDLVHVPRNEEDNLAENQCEEFRDMEVSHFIELDAEGNIVRIV